MEKNKILKLMDKLSMMLSMAINNKNAMAIIEYDFRVLTEQTFVDINFSILIKSDIYQIEKSDDIINIFSTSQELTNFSKNFRSLFEDCLFYYYEKLSDKNLYKKIYEEQDTYLLKKHD